MPYPKIPNGPLTISLNGLIMDHTLQEFADRYLPAFELEITSGYRSPQHNEEVGGAEFSAHQYNLARDFALKTKDGNLISAGKLEQIWEEYVKPNWPGYTYYHPPVSGVTGWIHVNLDREITTKTRFADWTLTGLAALFAAKKIFKKVKG